MLIGAALPIGAHAQAPASSQTPSRSVTAPAPAEPVDGRFAIQVLAAPVDVHAEPTLDSAVIAELQQGARVEAVERRGTWYRLRLSDGRIGWIGQVAGKANPNFSVDAKPRGAPAVTPDTSESERVFQRQPMGRPLEAIIPEIDPTKVPPPEPLLPRETIPVPDRWRLTDELGLTQNRWYDPYNPNTLKGDRPVFGEDWFVALNLVSDTVAEWRQVPTAIGAQSTDRAQSNDQFGRTGNRSSSKISFSGCR